MAETRYNRALFGLVLLISAGCLRHFYLRYARETHGAITTWDICPSSFCRAPVPQRKCRFTQLPLSSFLIAVLCNSMTGWHAWFTAVTTGLGVVPLMFTPKLEETWIAVSNVLAAGMMLSASASLVGEGTMTGNGVHGSSTSCVMAGILMGVVFITVSAKFLDNYEDLKLGNLSQMNAKKALLVMAVMFLHSFAEGVGIGAAFGGESGAHLGMFLHQSPHQ